MVRASAVTTGATSVIEPDHRQARRQPRALEMARDLVAHDVGLLQHLVGERIARPRAAASFTITDSGVFSACARLPTWVRARSTISLLASISALVSRASGAISSGNCPAEPLGAAGADGGEAVGDALERGETEPHLEHGGEQQHHAQGSKT